MRRCVIRARALALDNQLLEDKLIVISGKRIESIVASSVSHRFNPKDFVSNKRYLVAPGLVDIHVHGGGGAQPDSLGGLLAASYYHAAYGTTALLPTIFFRDLDHLKKMAHLVQDSRSQTNCHILGLNLEGPHINPQAKGAIDGGYIYKLTADHVRAMVAAAEGELKVVTVAPEMPGAEAVIKTFVEEGVIVSLGHSLATSEEAARAVDWGARLVTHLGNAMAPFHQRQPGLIGTALTDKRLIPEVIADGHHLAPETVAMFLKAREHEAVLVSDCRWVAGLPEGQHAPAEGPALTVKDGMAYLSDGAMAGGIYPLWHSVVQVAKTTSLTFWEALTMATKYPAKLLGKRQLGKLAVGGRADLVLAGPDLTVKRVFFGGEEIYHAEGEQPWIYA